jgi:hypothetical protein
MLWPSPIARVLAIICLVFSSFSAAALSVEDLRKEKDLTPPRFASYFRGFSFSFRKDVQRADAFLSTKKGDCDDYSILAAAILREKGYTPRLISIRMPGVTHVVCYIEETQSYLDYNFRGYTVAIGSSDNVLEKIANNVARSYAASWSSASEFTYASGVKRLVQTVVEPKAEAKSFAGIFR